MRPAMFALQCSHGSFGVPAPQAGAGSVHRPGSIVKRDACVPSRSDPPLVPASSHQPDADACARAQTAIKDAINKWEEKSAEDPAEATKVPCAFLPGAFPPRQSASSARQLLMLVLDR
jgi:hypothetical protein